MSPATNPTVYAFLPKLAASKIEQVPIELAQPISSLRPVDAVRDTRDRRNCLELPVAQIIGEICNHPPGRRLV